MVQITLTKEQIERIQFIMSVHDTDKYVIAGDKRTELKTLDNIIYNKLESLKYRK